MKQDVNKSLIFFEILENPLFVTQDVDSFLLLERLFGVLKTKNSNKQKLI